MSGVQIHTEDPIKPAKASGVTPQTAYSDAGNPSQPGPNATGSPYTYPPAQPGAAAPTPTGTIPQRSSYDPPAPQPGGTPVPPPPTTNASRGVPPPPKAGEKPLPAEHYAPARSTLEAKTQPYPSQMSQFMVDQPLRALPPGSTTSTSTEPSFQSSSQQSSIRSATDMPSRGSLEHPPGYVQNPFASDMTPDQRFAAEQQQENRSETLPSLGYVDNSKAPRPGLEDDQTLLGKAKKWAKETGQQASKLEEKIWNQFGADE